MGLEVVVRPVVLPSIRPQPPRVPVVIEEDDRVSEIIGRSGGAVTLTHSRRWSFQRASKRELSRTYDVVRVFNPEDEQQYVDIEVMKRLRMRGTDGNAETFRLCDGAPGANTVVLSTRQRRFC